MHTTKTITFVNSEILKWGCMGMPPGHTQTKPWQLICSSYETLAVCKKSRQQFESLLIYRKFVISTHFGQARACLAMPIQKLTITSHFLWNFTYMTKIKTIAYVTFGMPQNAWSHPPIYGIYFGALMEFYLYAKNQNNSLSHC